MSIVIPETSYRPVDQRQRLKIWAVSTWRRSMEAWSIYARNRLALLGLGLLLMYILMAIAHPILMRTVWPKTIYDPVVGHDMMIFPHPSLPSIKHPLGTDTLGRDVLSILMAATAPSLQMALTAALTAAAIGTLIGAVSAYYRGMVDSLFAHLADLSLLAPAPIVMVVIGFMMDIKPFQFGLLYGILVGVGAVAIVLRSHALIIMNRAFVDASRVAGGGAAHIVFKHLIPHMLPLAAVNMLLTVTGAIFAMGFIAFLGLSRAQLNWGSMIYDAFTYQQINGLIAWNVLIPSAMAISLFAASFYFIALGLQDVADPRLADRVSPIPRGKAVMAGMAGQKTRSVDGLTLEEPLLAASVDSEPVVTAPALISGMSVWEQTTTAEHGAAPFQAAETLPVTVLVASLQGGSSLIDGFQAESPHSRAIAILQQSAALVDCLDDSVMVACFGLAPTESLPAGASLAVQTALELKDFVDEYNRQRVAGGSANLKLGVGIASGSAIISQVEEAGKISQTLAGATGRAASTLQSFTTFMKNGGVLISEDTYICMDAAKGNYIFAHRGKVQPEEEEDQKAVYELLGRSMDI